MTPSISRRFARGLARLACALLPATHARWGEAMARELTTIEDDREAVRWAVGCARAAVVDRLRGRHVDRSARSRVGVWWDALRFDARFVLRSLRRAKGFTAVAVATIAVGIGVNLIVFSVVDRLLFRPLPYADADRLVQVRQFVSVDANAFAHTLYEVVNALRQESASLDGLGWDDGWDQEVVPTPGENPLLLTAVAPSSFDVLGVHPVIGRGFDAGDQARGADAAVVLTSDAWRARFGASDAVLSRRWVNGRTTYCVVGVLPAGFFFPSSRLEHRDGFFVDQRQMARAGQLVVAPFARLRPGVSLEAARAEIDVIMRRHVWQTVGPSAPHVTVEPLRTGLSVIVGPYLWVTSWAVWMVLAVVCVNLAILVLLRGRSRHHATAIRAALGASRGRLVRGALLESLMLALAGAVAGLTLSAWASHAMAALLPPQLRGVVVGPFDSRILDWCLTMTALTAVGAGLAPALAFWRVDVLTALRGDAVGARPTRPLAVGRGFLGLEAAFGVLVVVGAAVTVPPFVQFLLEPPGFEPADLYTVNVNHDWPDRADTAPARMARAHAIVDVLRAEPHVQAAAAVFTPPYTIPPVDSAFWKSHGVDEGNESAIGAEVFRTLRTTMLAGREFSPDEVAGAAPVAVLNDAGARALWPGVRASGVIGRQLDTAGGARTVVGVAADIRDRPGIPAVPALFLPITAADAQPTQSALPVIVRMTPGAIPDGRLMAARLNERFPRNGVAVESVAEELSPYVDQPRFLAVLFGALAAVTLLLAIMGAYAVAGFEAERCRREVAIRLALGASPRRVRGGLAGRLLVPVMAGVAGGLLLAWWGVRVFGARVAELGAADGETYVLAGLVMLAAAIAALWRPARRAGRVDPAVALREA